MTETVDKANRSGARLSVGTVLYVAVAMVLALTALTMSAARVALHYADVLRPEIVSLIERETSMQIAISELRGGWWGRNPSLRLSGLRISPTGRAEDALNLGEVDLELDLLESVRNWSIVPAAFSVENLVVRLNELDDGSWAPTVAIGGQSIEDLTDSLDQTMMEKLESALSLIGDGSYRLGNIDLVWRYMSGRHVQWRLPSVFLTKRRDTLELSTRVIQEQQEIMAFELFVDRSAGASPAATGYMRWHDDQVLQPFQRLLTADAALSLEDLTGQGELWLRYDAETADFEVNAAVDLAGLTLKVPESASAIPPRQSETFLIRDLSAQIAFGGRLDIGPGHRLEELTKVPFGFEQWQLRAANLDASWNDMPLLTSKLSARGGEDFHLAVDTVNLELVSKAAVASRQIGAEGVADIIAYGAEGRLTSLLVSQSADEGLLVRGMLRDATVQAAYGAPMIERLDAYLHVEDSRGHVTYADEDVGLQFPDLYEESWQLPYAEGRVDWSFYNGITQVWGTRMTLDRPNEKPGLLQAEFDLLNPDAEDQPESLQLAIHMHEADSALVAAFLPTRILDKALSEWVLDAVQGGQIRRGSYFYSGVVGEAADATNSSSQMAFDVQDGTLKFAEEWPALTELSTRLKITDDSVSADISTAKINGLPISNGRVELREDKGQSLLDASFTSQPEAADWNYWLRSSPVAETTRPVAGDWQLSGPSVVSTALTVNLDSAEAEALRVRIDANDMSVSSKEHDLSADQVRGRFEYSMANGVSGKSEHLRLQGEKASLSIQSPVWNEATQQVQVRASTRVSLASLRKRVTLPEVVRLEGGAEISSIFGWTGTANNDRYSLLIRSDLRGVAFDYPQPFGKSADERRNLELEVRWSEQARAKDYRFQLGELVGGDISVVTSGTGATSDLEDLQGRIRFGGIKADNRVRMNFDRLGQPAAPVPGQLPDVSGGLDISGYLPRLNVSEWRAFLSKEYGQDDQGEIAVLVDEPVLNQRARQLVSNWPDWLTGVDLTIAELMLDETLYKEFAILASRNTDNSVDVAVDVPNLMKGAIRVPGGANEYPTARLAYLKIPEAEGEASDEKSTFTPTDVPLGDVSIDALDYGAQSLGSWRWIAEKRDEGVVFRDLRATVEGARLEGRLSWLREPITQQQTTILTGELSGEKFEQIYSHFQGPAPMTAADYRFKTGVVWTGTPFDFSWENLSGQISMRLRDGRFTETSRSADLFKVFSVLNMDTLVRRLKLDFSDIYEAGISYDDIEGSAKIKEGVVDFESPLAIQATSSAFQLTGTMSMVTDALDMELLVVLPLTKNLPLAALLVGAPQIGGALFLIDKLMGDALSKLTSATYELTGTLEDPEVNLKQSFGDPR
ncbi:YhdP family protein [Allohahella marinimesophila]|uniref:YhdP family protein n=1 Tax=Allohahella marinimesophila TaxID=1054972 RepID=A0ABP7PY95_9GAMM